MQSLVSIKPILSGSVSFTQLFSFLPVVGGKYSGSLSLLRCDPGFFSNMGPKSVQDIMSCGGKKSPAKYPSPGGNRDRKKDVWCWHLKGSLSRHSLFFVTSLLD